MQFRVPQFIDIEDKIFGPFTLKQFAYIIGALGFSFIIWTFISNRLIAFILILPVAGLFVALAFVKVNERPFVDMLESAFKYITSSKIYTWKQPTVAEGTENKKPNQIVTEATKSAVIENVKANRLHEISVGLDILDRNDIGENS